MEHESANFYLRWAVVVLIASLTLNGIGYVFIAFRIHNLKSEIAKEPTSALDQSGIQPSAGVLSAATASASITSELASIKDEIIRLRVEQNNINRILELTVSPSEVANILSNYEVGE